jgi:hypothetical protein
MEENAIREGFAHLKPSTEYDALYKAALCRERADWMVGINASRLFSCLYGQPLAVGRVMTPVLAIKSAGSVLSLNTTGLSETTDRPRSVRFRSTTSM